MYIYFELHVIVEIFEFAIMVFIFNFKTDFSLFRLNIMDVYVLLLKKLILK